MGERKGQNKYYPPDFDYKKHFSLNGYHGVHHLRERGKKAHEGILIIRFEMPFNCWCLSCNNPIGMGVRYDSEKKKVGYFYSTPIYQFKMTCKMCHGEIIIQTDPEHFQYSIIKGLRRREQRYTAEDTGLPELDDSKTKERLATDAMFHLEHEYKDVKSSEMTKPVLKKLLIEKSKIVDDFALNQLARKKFREEKKARKSEQDSTENVAEKLNLIGGEVVILPRNDDDREAAAAAIRNSQFDLSETAVEKRLKKLKSFVKGSISNRSSTKKSNPFSIKRSSLDVKKKFMKFKQNFKKQEVEPTKSDSSINTSRISLVSGDYDDSGDE